MLLLEKREPIQRFSGSNPMPQKDFFKFFLTIFPFIQNNSIDLSLHKQVIATEKMDSVNCSWGINRKGNFFIESANSGEVTADKKDCFNNIFLKDFYETINYLMSYEPFQNGIKHLFHTWGPVKFDSELFPILTHETDERGDIIFSTTKYNKKKLGEKGAFVIFDIKEWSPIQSTWIPSTNKPKILREILDIDSGKWRIFSADKHARLFGQIPCDITPILPIMQQDNWQVRMENSLKQPKESLDKQLCEKILNELSDSMQKGLDAFVKNTSSVFSNGKDKYPIEGVILKVYTDKEPFIVKGINDEYTQNKDKCWKARHDISSLQQKTEALFLKDALGFTKTQPASINADLQKVANRFRSNKIGEARFNDYLSLVKDSLVDKNFVVDENRIRETGLNILNFSQNALNKIESNWNNIKPECDINTIRKTDEAITYMKNLLSFFKKHVISKAVNGDSYYYWIMKVILARRLEKVNVKEEITEDGQVVSNAEEPKKCLVWLGRAQPWHAGHDKMVKRGIEEAKRNNADLVIQVVRGTKEDVERNPLDEEKQIGLIKSLYAHVPNIIVEDKPLENGYIGNLIEKLYRQNRQLTGIICGSDRAEQYKEQILSLDESKYNYMEYSPIELSERFIVEVSRDNDLSGTLARDLATKLSFDNWLLRIAPSDVNPKAKKLYKEVYDQIFEKIGMHRKGQYTNNLKEIFKI